MKNKIITLLFLFSALCAFGQYSINPIFSEAPIKEYSQKKSDPYMNWGIKKLGIDKIHRQGITGKGIKICICDTGKPDHKKLKGILIESANFSFDSLAIDGNGHGTHVAGEIHEIAPSAKIMTAKVLAANGWGTTEQTIEGIEWCIKKGSNIINLSLGSSAPSPKVKALLQQASDKGIIVVCAAGNDGIGLPLNWPSAYSSTLAIGSIDSKFDVSWYSCSGQGDFVAPGEEVLGLWINNEYRIISGTSMSTPFMSGLIALILEKYGKLRQMKAVDLMKKGFDSISFSGYPDVSKIFETPISVPVPEPPIIVAPVDTVKKDSIGVDTLPSEEVINTPVDTSDVEEILIPVDEGQREKSKTIYIIIAILVGFALYASSLFKEKKKKPKL